MRGEPFGKKRTQFSGKIGFILAAAGSAVGLGKYGDSPIWQQNTAAAPFFFYILFAITFGFSL